MSSSEQQDMLLKVWVLKWQHNPGGRGRKHAVIFIPNSTDTNIHPTSGVSCRGTVYHVQGSPFTGFRLQIRRNWDSSLTRNLETATQVGFISQQYIWQPPNSAFIAEDNERRSEVDRCALFVQTPAICRRPWVAEDVMDCQDWIVSFVERMVQRQMVSATALAAVRNSTDARVALMRDPDAPRAETFGDRSSLGPPTGDVITASVARPFGSSWQQQQRQPQQEQQQPYQQNQLLQNNQQQGRQSQLGSQTFQSRPSDGFPLQQASREQQLSYQQRQPVQYDRQQIGQGQQGFQTSQPRPSMPLQTGQSEWRPERARFERYNYTATRWEYFDHDTRQWFPCSR